MDEEYIFAKIKELLPDEHQVPRGVLYSKLKTEIQKDVSETLNKMLKYKSISFSTRLSMTS